MCYSLICVCLYIWFVNTIFLVQIITKALLWAVCVCFVSFISYFLLDSSNIPLSHVYCSHALLFYKMMRFFLLLLTLFPPSFVCLCVSQSVRRVHSFIHSLQRLSSILHWFWRTILVLLWPFIEIFIGFLFSFFLVPRIPVPKAPSIEERWRVKQKTLNSLFEYIWRNGNCSRQCLQWTSPAPGTDSVRHA